MASHRAYIAPFERRYPLFQAPPLLGTHAAVVGGVRIGRDASLAPYSVVRADGNDVEIGNNFYLGFGATVHVSDEYGPTIVGEGVTVEANAVVHACEIGDGCFVGRNAVVLDGSRIGDGAEICADSIVYPRSTLRGGWAYAGQPARAVRQINAHELLRAHEQARRPAPAASGRDHVATTPCEDRSNDVFVAATALIAGQLSAQSSSSIWFGCRLDAAHFEIAIGPNSNVQDNVEITCRSRGVHIGANTTIGHNACLTDCEIGSQTLIGIGAVLAPDTIVADHVLLAAGARTKPGQVLESGWVWAGRPARPTKPLDDKMRHLIARICPTYRMFAREFQRVQHQYATAYSSATGLSLVNLTTSPRNI